MKVKWNSNLPESPFGNCRLRLGVVLFFRSEQNSGTSSHLLFQESITVTPASYRFLSFHSFSSAENNYEKSNCNLVRLVCWFWKKSYHYSPVNIDGNPSRFILALRTVPLRWDALCQAEIRIFLTAFFFNYVDLFSFNGSLMISLVFFLLSKLLFSGFWRR